MGKRSILRSIELRSRAERSGERVMRVYLNRPSQQFHPPSTESVAPVTKLASSLNNQTMALAASSEVPMRLMGVSAAGGSVPRKALRFCTKGVSIVPL